MRRYHQARRRMARERSPIRLGHALSPSSNTPTKEGKPRSRGGALNRLSGARAFEERRPTAVYDALAAVFFAAGLRRLDALSMGAVRLALWVRSPPARLAVIGPSSTSWMRLPSARAASHPAQPGRHAMTPVSTEQSRSLAADVATMNSWPCHSHAGAGSCERRGHGRRHAERSSPRPHRPV